MNKKAFISIFIILIIILVIGVFFTTKKTKNNTILTKTDTSQKSTQQKQFENFLKEHGEEITLETVDTTNWQTYTDEERGFSFKYPNDWYVIVIDSSRSIEGLQRPDLQEMYKKEQDWGIKSQTHSFKFLCVTDSINYASIPEQYRRNINADSEVDDEYCDITFSQYHNTWNGEKRTSGELWVEHHINAFIQSGKEKSDEQYINNQEVYLINKAVGEWLFGFISKNQKFMSILDNGASAGDQFDKNIYNSIIQSLSYTK